MADYDLKYTGAQIDGLLDAANELKTNGYIYKGVATPSTNPGTPSERVAYLASEPGTYTNFGGIVITSGLYSLTYASGTWTGTQMQAGSDIAVVQTTGQSTSDVMSQKAGSDAVTIIEEIDLSSLQTGAFYLMNYKWYEGNTSTGAYIKQIAVLPGEIYRIVSQSGKGVRLFFMAEFYPVKDTTATYTTQVIPADTTTDVTIPNGCLFMIMQDEVNVGNAGNAVAIPSALYKVTKVNEVVEEHSTFVDNADDILFPYTTISEYGNADCVNGKILRVNGTLFDKASWKTSNFITIPDAATEIIYDEVYFNNHDVFCGIVMADSNQKVIWFDTRNDPLAKLSGSISLADYPSAAYIRFCVYNGNATVKFVKREEVVASVINEVGTVKAAVTINEESVQFISGQGIDGTLGYVVADANAKRTDYIKIGRLKEGDTIVWGGTAKGNILAYYDYNYRLLTAYTATGTSRTITASAAAAAMDIVYARITFSASGTPVFTINGKNILNQTSYELALDGELDKHLPAEGIAVGERMRGVESAINDTMVVTSANPTLKNGYFIDGNGEEAAAEGWSCTDYINIPKLNDGDSIYWGGISHYPSASLAFYDRFKHLITVYSAYLSPKTSTSRTITFTNSSVVVINDAHYVRASFSGSPVLTLNGNTLFTKHQVVTDSTMTLDMPANARGVDEYVGSLIGISIFKNGYFININGDEERSDTWCYARIDLDTPVQGGDVFVWSGITDNLNALIGFYGGNGSYIGGWSATGTSRTFTISNSSVVIGATTIKASFLISSENRSVSINGVNQDFSYIKEDKSVADYNADKQPMVVSLSRTKVNDSTLKKYFCFAQITDTHSENILVQRAVDFVNSEVFGSSIDCLVHTGDIQHTSFDQGDMPAFHDAMDNSKKPAFTVLGNHDVYKSTSVSALYERFMKPMVDKGLLVDGINIDAANYATWYYYDFTEYSIRLIALNDFDPLYDGYTKPLNTTAYSPSQINFLISTLQSVPSGYTVIIVDHFPTNKGTGYSGTTINPDWTMGVSPIGGGHSSLFTGNQSPVIDILSAYKSKTSLVQSYTYSNSSVASHYGSVDVNVDFTSANGILAFMACGHSHNDEIYKFADKNNIIAIDMLGGVNPTIIDSPTKILRTYNGKAHDAINVYCVRTDERKVYIVRIGADFRDDGQAQIITSLEY